ncbi:hypothetical protein GA597_05815 [Staphylococcus haemolyticus]|uniref:hypothetical protein n=1 Tax=Staphylococcus haemolyticus TaxID=1283 RepID=UPI000E75638A|nr:hypothetical protein [Staphylococcus haemolyticus]QFR06350.1 hypothetical protein GA597_05815 [Staphylococcus haemolyticus]
MKKFLVLLFSSLLVLGACGQDEDNSNKDDNKKSESKSDKKSNDPKKDKKLENKDKSNKNTNDDKQQASSDDSNNDVANNESESTSKNDNEKTQSDNGNERPQGKQATQQQQQNTGNQQANNNQQQSSNQQPQNNNNYMTQDEINEWNKNKPTTHNESQMGYGRAEYEEARKASAQVWDDPNAHVGGPIWVGKNEGYDSWAKRQQEAQEAVVQQ